MSPLASKKNHLVQVVFSCAFLAVMRAFTESRMPTPVLKPPALWRFLLTFLG